MNSDYKVQKALRRLLKAKDHRIEIIDPLQKVKISKQGRKKAATAPKMVKRNDAGDGAFTEKDQLAQYQKEMAAAKLLKKNIQPDRPTHIPKLPKVQKTRLEDLLRNNPDSDR